MTTITAIDTPFSRSVDSGSMPGIVAAAAIDRGTIYEGAFGP